MVVVVVVVVITRLADLECELTCGSGAKGSAAGGGGGARTVLLDRRLRAET
jgi:hypothetical protein